jgi:hypothetical protein
MNDLNRLLEKYLSPVEYQKFKELIELLPEESYNGFIDLDEAIPGPAVAKSLRKREELKLTKYSRDILDIYRPFWKYPDEFTKVLNGNNLTRILVLYCYLHLEETLKVYKKQEAPPILGYVDGKPILGSVKGPLGRLIKFVDDKHVLEDDVVSDLNFINAEYLTKMKHKGGFNEDDDIPEFLTIEEAEALDNHLFSREEAISIYFLIRRLVVLLVDKLLLKRLE